MESGEINGYLIQMQNSNELHCVDSLGRIWLKEEKAVPSDIRRC